MGLLCTPARRPPQGNGFFADAKATAILTILVLVYISFFCATSWLTYWSFGMSAYDIGIHDQAIWKLAYLRGFFNTIRGMNIWGDHCWLIMALIAPIYRVVPRLETLLAVQSAALALGAFPLAAYAYRRIGSRAAALLLAAAFLLSPALQNMNLENAHPEVLAVPFLLWMIAAAEAASWPAYGAAFLLALFCKEDIALTTGALGLYIFLRRSRRAGLFTMALSAIYFLVCMKFILPFSNGVGFFRFHGGYWFSEFWAHKLDPVYYSHILARPLVWRYAWKLSFPLLGLFLLDPLLFFAALPGFVINVLSGNDYLIGIDYHYNYHTLPVLFAAAAGGIAVSAKWLRGRPSFATLFRESDLTGERAISVLLALHILVFSLAANITLSQAPIYDWGARIVRQSRYLRDSGDWRRFQRLAACLPADPDIPVAASHNLVPALTHRSETYMFPNPWQTVYWGVGGERPASPGHVQWLVLDSRIIAGDQLPLVTRLLSSGEFRKVAQDGNWFVAKRIAPASKH